MTFGERMKNLASKAGDAAQNFASKAEDAVHDIGGKGVQASKGLLARAEDKAQGLGTKGLHASKELIGKAGEKVQELGEKGKTAIEIKLLESKAQKLMAQLGAEVYEALAEQKLPSVSTGTPVIKDIFQQLESIQAEIGRKEEERGEFKGK
jgi:general stress protein YciG